MTSAAPPTLSDRLIDTVRDRIIAGQHEPGEPIRQDALAAALGVSKIPLREALARLEEEGLLRSAVNRGWFVTPLSIAEAREVYALRLTLEPAAAAQAAAVATAEQRGEAEAALHALDKAVQGHGPEVGASNRAFHLSLIRPAGQPITFDILQRLNAISDRYVRKHLEPVGRDTRANDEHRALLDAWLARDRKAVTALLHTHIAQTLDDLENQLRAD